MTPLIRVTFSVDAPSQASATSGGATVPLVADKAIAAADASDSLKRHAQTQAADPSAASAPEVSTADVRKREQEAIATAKEKLQADIAREGRAAWLARVTTTAASGDVIGTSRTLGKAAVDKMLGQLKPEDRTKLFSALARASVAGATTVGAARFLGSDAFAGLTGFLGGARGGTFGAEGIRQFFAEPFLQVDSLIKAFAEAGHIETALRVSGAPTTNMDVIARKFLLATGPLSEIQASEQRVIDRMRADVAFEAGKASGNFLRNHGLDAYRFLKELGSGWNRILRGLAGN